VSEIGLQDDRFAEGVLRSRSVTPLSVTQGSLRSREKRRFFRLFPLASREHRSRSYCLKGALTPILKPRFMRDVPKVLHF